MMVGMEVVIGLLLAGLAVVLLMVVARDRPTWGEPPAPPPPPEAGTRVGKVIVHTRDEHSIEGLLIDEDASWVHLEKARLVDGDADPVALAGRIRVPAGNVRMIQEV